MHEVTGYTISAMPHLQKLRGTENVNGKNIYSDKSVARKITLKSPTVKGDYSYGSVYGPYLDTAHLAQVRSVVPVSYTHLDVYKRQLQKLQLLKHSLMMLLKLRL